MWVCGQRNEWGEEVVVVLRTYYPSPPPTFPALSTPLSRPPAPSFTPSRRCLAPWTDAAAALALGVADEVLNLARWIWAGRKKIEVNTRKIYKIFTWRSKSR